MKNTKDNVKVQPKAANLKKKKGFIIEINDTVIEHFIIEKIFNGDMFSAYDITVELRNIGFEVFHKQVKKVIKKDIDFKVHRYTSHSDPTKTFLIYHDINVDVSQYKNNKTPITIISTPSGTSPLVDLLAKSSKWTTLYPQTKGRINISKSILNSIDYFFKDGDYIDINVSNTKKTKCASNTYRLTSRGIRISYMIYQDIIGIKKQYVIKNENGIITIY